MFKALAVETKALAVETRVKIIDLLKSEGPLGAKKISELLGVTPAAVSQHLKILKQAGFVRSERNGYWIPYSIDEGALNNCREVLTEICTWHLRLSRNRQIQRKRAKRFKLGIS